MMTQGMRSESISDRGLVSASMSNGIDAKKSGQTNGFQDVMDRNLTKERPESKKVPDQSVVQKKDARYQPVQKPDQMNQQTAEKTENVIQSPEDAEQIPWIVDNEDVIATQTEKLMKTLQDVLGLSTEELVELMNKLGMGAQDLYNQDNLMKLLLTVSGSEDPSGILTDETLSGKFNELLTALNEAAGEMEKHGLTAEHLNQWQEQWKSLENNQPELNQPTVEQPVVESMAKQPAEEQPEAELNPEIKEPPSEKNSQSNVQEQPIPDKADAGMKEPSEPTIEVVQIGEAVKVLGKPETESESEVQGEAAQLKDTPVVSNVQAEDSGNSEENVLLEKQDAAGKKENSASVKNEEEPRSQFESFMTQLTKNSKTVTTEMVQGQNGQVTTVREIVNQVVSRIRMVIQPDMSSMELQLNPEHLGKVQLSVTVHQGEMTANFVVQNETAKAALESQIQLLRENLNNQGLKVEAIEVTVSDFSFSQSNGSGEAADSRESGKRQSARQINLEDLNELDQDLSEEEVMAVKMMRQNGGTIDYTA